MDPAPLYRAHLDILLARVATALQRGGFDAVLARCGVQHIGGRLDGDAAGAGIGVHALVCAVPDVRAGGI